MKKNLKYLIILPILVLLTISVAIGIDLSDKGVFRLWKEAENHVKIQRTITDPNGTLTVVWEKSYGMDEAESNLLDAQKEYIFWRDVNSIDYVAAQKKKAGIKVLKWRAIVDKFSGAIDVE